MQRAIWIITFFIILAIGYYWVVVDDSRTQKMVELADSDKELSGDVNSTVEIYDRLEKKWIGTSKHVQTLQQETHAHYAAYADQMEQVELILKRWHTWVRHYRAACRHWVGLESKRVRSYFDHWAAVCETGNELRNELLLRGWAAARTRRLRQTVSNWDKCVSATLAARRSALQQLVASRRKRIMRHWREAARRLKKAGAAARRVAAAREKLVKTETFSV